MIFGLLLLVVIFILYILLVKGALWKIIVFVFGYFGMYVFLTTYIPQTKHTCLIFDQNHISWAMVIPTVIIILALAYTNSE
jgi:hypothetical protein